MCNYVIIVTWKHRSTSLVAKHYKLSSTLFNKICVWSSLYQWRLCPIVRLCPIRTVFDQDCPIWSENIVMANWKCASGQSQSHTINRNVFLILKFLSPQTYNSSVTMLQIISRNIANHSLLLYFADSIVRFLPWIPHFDHSSSFPRIPHYTRSLTSRNSTLANPSCCHPSANFLYGILFPEDLN